MCVVCACTVCVCACVCVCVCVCKVTNLLSLAFSISHAIVQASTSEGYCHSNNQHSHRVGIRQTSLNNTSQCLQCLGKESYKTFPHQHFSQHLKQPRNRFLQCQVWAQYKKGAMCRWKCVGRVGSTRDPRV